MTLIFYLKHNFCRWTPPFQNSWICLKNKAHYGFCIVAVMANNLHSLGSGAIYSLLTIMRNLWKDISRKSGQGNLLKAAQSEWYANDDSLFLQMQTFIAMFVCLENI